MKGNRREPRRELRPARAVMPPIPGVEDSAANPEPEPRHRRRVCTLYPETCLSSLRQANHEPDHQEDDPEDPEYLPEEDAEEPDTGDDGVDNLITGDDWYED